MVNDGIKTCVEVVQQIHHLEGGAAPSNLCEPNNVTGRRGEGEEGRGGGGGEFEEGRGGTERDERRKEGERGGKSGEKQ